MASVYVCVHLTAVWLKSTPYRSSEGLLWIVSQTSDMKACWLPGESPSRDEQFANDRNVKDRRYSKLLEKHWGVSALRMHHASLQKSPWFTRYIHHYCHGIHESKMTCNANGVATRDKPTVNYQLPNLKSEGSISSVKQFIILNVIWAKTQITSLYPQAQQQVTDKQKKLVYVAEYLTSYGPNTSRKLVKIYNDQLDTNTT